MNQNIVTPIGVKVNPAADEHGNVFIAAMLPGGRMIALAFNAN